MQTWFTLRDSPRTPGVIELAEVIDKKAALLRNTQGETGGLSRTRLVGAVTPSLARFALTDREVTSFSGHELDLWSAESGLAVSLQTGRAYTNNGTLLAVLAAAAHRPVDWAVIAVPETYKGGAQYAPAAAQLHDLFKARGIALDLNGTVLVSY